MTEAAKEASAEDEDLEINESEFSKTMALPIVRREPSRLRNVLAILFVGALAAVIFGGLAQPEKVQSFIEDLKKSAKSESE